MSIIRIHGMSGTRFYGIWNDMMMRCYNPNKQRFACYGGRGILVSKKWRIFNNFYVDMFPSYEKGLSLERKRVNGNYCKSNCIWIPIKDQWKNKTTTVKLTIDGKSLTIPEWSIISGIKKCTIYERKSKGWDHRKCVFHPSRSKP